MRQIYSKGLEICMRKFRLERLLKHLWAAASHYLQYKERRDIAEPLQRRMSILSALLENVDDSFDELLSKKEEYKRSSETSASSEILSVDLLGKMFEDESPASQGFSQDEDLSSILDLLFKFNVKTVSDFRGLLNKHKAEALEYKMVGDSIMTNKIGIKGPITFSVWGIIQKILKCEFDPGQGYEFFQ